MKFVDSYTDPEHRLSCVRVEYRGKVYEGRALCHEEDDWSEFTGCRYAQERAEIVALKDQWQEAKAACEECRKFVNAVSQYKNFDKESPTAKAMYRQLNRRIKAVNELADEIGRKQFNLDVAIRQQDGFNKRVNQIKLNNIEEN